MKHACYQTMPQYIQKPILSELIRSRHVNDNGEATE